MTSAIETITQTSSARARVTGADSRREQSVHHSAMCVGLRRTPIRRSTLCRNAPANQHSYSLDRPGTILRLGPARMRTALQPIVIVGGGFGGVKCAKRLRRQLSAETSEIILFNRENHMVFHPLLPEVAGASINPDAVAAPLRQMLTGVKCRTETVRSIDFTNRIIEFEAHDGSAGSLPYDHVVIAC